MACIATAVGERSRRSAAQRTHAPIPLVQPGEFDGVCVHRHMVREERHGIATGGGGGQRPPPQFAIRRVHLSLWPDGPRNMGGV